MECKLEFVSAANEYGENLAYNAGTGSWSKKPSPDSVMTRFVENEEFLPPPQNYHFTQVLWKATGETLCKHFSSRQFPPLLNWRFI
mmetsp:Transcript_14999/g.31511  ORF Transcript_14999/g.31511 Transcript_14999/m.31511 type:complete len:86 (+) Transcript_14999:1213-1470(+)